jgi:predicted DNA-binding protein with PD1-like motif
MTVEGLWFKEVRQGRRFLVKIAPGESLSGRLVEWARQAGVSHAVVVSAVGSVRDVQFRGIKAGAKLPLTKARVSDHAVAGPLELLGVSGNLFPDERGAVDCHLHVLAARSSGEVLGGHLYEATVFASCEVVMSELVAEGVERHRSATGGVRTVFIDEQSGDGVLRERLRTLRRDEP